MPFSNSFTLNVLFFLFTKEVKEACDILQIDGKCPSYRFGPLRTTYIDLMQTGSILPYVLAVVSSFEPELSSDLNRVGTSYGFHPNRFIGERMMTSAFML